jgi:hypothetical protein
MILLLQGTINLTTPKKFLIPFNDFIVPLNRDLFIKHQCHGLKNKMKIPFTPYEQKGRNHETPFTF